MSDRQFTLIDVMRGIRKHGLVDKTPDGCFKFLIGLILEANELGFKNPIDMTVNQALAIGGGESRQTLYNRRKALGRILIDGKHLVKVKVGSYGQKSLATYDLDYKLLCSYNGIWAKENRATSNEIDEGLTQLRPSFDVTLDDPLPILRSDQKREEEINDDLRLPPEAETEEEKRHDRICTALKEGIGGDPDTITLVSNTKQLDAFNEILEHKDENILAAIKYTAEKGKLHQDNAVAYVRTALVKGWYGNVVSGGNGDGRLSGAKLDGLEEEYRLLSEQLQEVKDSGKYEDPRNKAWLAQTEPKIENLRGLIAQHGGKA